MNSWPLARRAATEGWVRRWSSWATTFSSVSTDRDSWLTQPQFSWTTTLATSAWRSQAFTVGMRSRVCGSITAFIAPQSEWPQMMMWCTPRAITANSMAVDTPPFICP
ncbi:hypothetical protein FQZ97_346870 [compost metagenome]